MHYQVQICDVWRVLSDKYSQKQFRWNVSFSDSLSYRQPIYSIKLYQRSWMRPASVGLKKASKCRLAEKPYRAGAASVGPPQKGGRSCKLRLVFQKSCANFMCGLCVPFLRGPLVSISIHKWKPFAPLPWTGERCTKRPSFESESADGCFLLPALSPNFWNLNLGNGHHLLVHSCHLCISDDNIVTQDSIGSKPGSRIH